MPGADFSIRRPVSGFAAGLLVVGFMTMVPAGEPLRIAVFRADVTPPLGSRLAYTPARSIVDPLDARGVILLGSDAPIVLCAVDWIGIGNGGHDAWRERLALAAGTTADRVAVHTLHQHDAPHCDFTVSELLAPYGLAGQRFDDAFAREALGRAVAAVEAALLHTQTVTHIGIGTAQVEQVASNRRLLGADGKVKIVRYSATRNVEAIAAPEGVIDPTLGLVSFWNGEMPVAVLTYYATHPQSYYGKGDVSCDFVGLARNSREKETGIPHIHFNGASGNVAAGKYNDGSPERRPVLAARLADGMRQAWKAVAESRASKVPVVASDLGWRTHGVRFPPAERLDAEQLKATLADESAAPAERIRAARKLVFLARAEAGHETTLACLRLGAVRILHMPGELFVEYQLAAKSVRADAPVFMAAYGDFAAGYVGTKVAYSQGGYETGPDVSLVSPEVEQILNAAVRELLTDREEKKSE